MVSKHSFVNKHDSRSIFIEIILENELESIDNLRASYTIDLIDRTFI